MYTRILTSIICLSILQTKAKGQHFPNTCPPISPITINNDNTSCQPLDSIPQNPTNSPSQLQPYCTQSTYPNSGSFHEKFCIYTNLSPNLGPILSILTTPSPSESLINGHPLPSYLNPSASSRGLPPPSEQLRKRKNLDAIQIVEKKGRGKGVFAKKRIEKGQSVLIDYPMLMIDMRGLNAFDEGRKVELIWGMVGRLPGRERGMIRGLAGDKGKNKKKKKNGEKKEEDEMDELMNILETNGFAISKEFEGKRKKYVALVPRSSRFNHDCRPNAHYVFDREAMRFTTFAVRDIDLGEEVTFSYIIEDAPYAGFEERRVALRETWNFECGCDSCKQKETKRAMSDARLKMIERGEKDLKKLSLDNRDDVRKAVQLTEGLLNLYELERLWLPLAEFWETAAVVFRAAGRNREALEFAGKTLEYLVWGTEKEIPED